MKDISWQPSTPQEQQSKPSRRNLREGTCIHLFNNDVIREKALWKQSLFMTYHRYMYTTILSGHYSFLSCSPLFCQYVVSLDSIFTIWENSLRTKLTDFSAFPQVTSSLLKAFIGCQNSYRPEGMS